MQEAAERIRERNAEIDAYPDAVKAAAEDFYEQHQDEIDALYDEPSGLDLHLLTPESAEYDEKMALLDRFDHYMQNEMDAKLSDSARRENLRGLIQHLDEPRFQGFPFEVGEAVKALETENYRDYMQLLGDTVDADEDTEAAYLLCGDDVMPAAVIDGHWTYVGLNFDAHQEAYVADTPVTQLPQDVTEGLPQIPDGTLDLALVKTPGTVFDPTEAFYALVGRKLDDNGVLAADLEPLGDTFTVEEELTPAPTTISKYVEDPFGGEGYNVKPLTLYQVRD